MMVYWTFEALTTPARTKCKILLTLESQLQLNNGSIHHSSDMKDLKSVNKWLHLHDLNITRQYFMKLKNLNGVKNVQYLNLINRIIKSQQNNNGLILKPIIISFNRPNLAFLKQS